MFWLGRGLLMEVPEARHRTATAPTELAGLLRRILKTGRSDRAKSALKTKIAQLKGVGNDEGGARAAGTARTPVNSASTGNCVAVPGTVRTALYTYLSQPDRDSHKKLGGSST